MPWKTFLRTHLGAVAATDFFSVEVLTLIVPLGESHLRRAVSEYVEHHHLERNHQGVGNRLLTPAQLGVRPANGNAPVERHERLGGLLKQQMGITEQQPLPLDEKK